MGQWSELPQELKQVILRKVMHNSTIDRIQIGAVCSLARSVSLERPTSLHPQIPSLIFRYSGEDKSKKSLFYMFSVSHDKFFLLDVPDISTRYCFCRGSSQGWLVMADGNSRTISLINPITRAEIGLPPSMVPELEYEIDDYAEEYLQQLTNDASFWARKVVLSSPPTLNGYENCVVMALCGESGKLAFCRPGDTAWTEVACGSGGFCDLICCDGQFYAATRSGKIVVCELGPFPRGRQIGTPQGFKPIANSKHYLVESSEEILLVTLTSWYDIDVYKLDRILQQWFKVKSVKDHTLFLSPKSSYSLLSSNYPGLIGNRAYFLSTDPDNYELIYNLEKRHLDGSFCDDEKYSPELDLNSAVWISPSLW